MSHLYRYVLVNDNGMAPCVDNSLLTLATCKPDLRKSARVEDWVLAWYSISSGRGLLPWAGRVSQVLSLGDYFEEFGGIRDDAVYQRVGMLGDVEILRSTKPWYHPQLDKQRKDIRGANVLLFEHFWYWGENAVRVPDMIVDKMGFYGQGYKYKDSDGSWVKQLESWLQSIAPPGKHGNPRDRARECQPTRRKIAKPDC